VAVGPASRNVRSQTELRRSHLPVRTRSLVQKQKQRYIFVMCSTSEIIRDPYQTMVSVCVVFFLCVCILSQMLGAPVTLISLLASDDRSMGAVSEDSSLLPTVPDLWMLRRLCIYIELQPSLHLPVFATSVFHPPC
jgi:hypothetical protein